MLVSAAEIQQSNRPCGTRAQGSGLRLVAFAIQDIDGVVAGLRARGVELVGELENYEDTYRLCYIRGPEGIIVELTERIA